MNIIIIMYRYIEKRSITKCFVAINHIMKLNIAKFVNSADSFGYAFPYPVKCAISASAVIIAGTII